jgi:hypothetical protein
VADYADSLPVFPIVASLIPAEELPPFMGILYVVLVFLMVLVGMAITLAARDKVSHQVEHATYDAYRSLAVVPLILLVLFFVVSERIRWEVLQPGLAWRSWLLRYVLPSAIALYGADARTGRKQP